MKIYAIREYWPWESVGNFDEFQGSKIIEPLYVIKKDAEKALEKIKADPARWESDNFIEIVELELNE